MDSHIKFVRVITLLGFLATTLTTVNAIYKARNANKKEYLFVTWLEYQGALACSGTLVGEEWVLTSARCLYNTTLADYRVAVGDVIVTNPNDGQQFYTPIFFVLHPDYNDTSKENDVAMMLLPEALDTREKTIDVVDMMSYSMDDIIDNKETCTLVGFGEISDGEAASRKMKLNVRITKDRDCEGGIVAGYDSNVQLCYRNKRGKSSACEGDEGGPVVCTVNGTDTQVGMIWDTSCSNTLTAATKVSAYLPWIQEVVANYSYERCTSLPTVPNGAYVLDGPAVVNSTAQLECDSGFEPTLGDDTVTCQAGGEYSVNDVSCGCGTPPSVSDGNFTTNGTNAVGDEAVLSCSTGFESSSDVIAENTITCQNTGAWSSLVASCVTMCPPPTPVANATFEPEAAFYSADDTVVLVCDSGFVRSPKNDDKASIKCRAAGTWTNNKAVCTRSCLTLPPATNGTFESDSSDLIVGDTAVLSCDAGFIRSVTNDTDATVTCESDGTWSTTNATCLESCGQPTSTVANATISVNGTNFGDTATLTCDAGYVASSSNATELTITCATTGEWSDWVVTCLRTCGNVPSPLNGTFTLNSGLLVNDTALLECDSGFVRSTTNDSDATITCKSDGVWTSTDANCLRTCGNVPSPLNGTYTVNSGLLVNDTALLECDSGFVRSTTNDSDATITCESDGVWTSTGANCLRTCGNVPSPLNGTFTVNSGLLVNGTALLECDSGFVRSTTNDSDATITCGSDGVWTSTDVSCLRTCGNVPSPLNGTFTVNTGLLVNDTALLECDSGFVRSTTNDSDATITCESDGVWTSTDTNCLRTCGNVPSPLNGTFTVNSGLLVNDTALLECDSGFVRSTTNDSDATITCESDGVWTSTDANCLRTCGNVPSPLNGTFTVNSGLLVNDTALLECDSGFVRSATNDSDATLTCESDGVWTSTDAICLRTCGNVPSPLNGTYTVNSGLLVNDTALLECDSGFVRSTTNDSDATITCKSDGVWTSNDANCLRTCGNVPSPLNGTYTVNSGLLVNDTALLECDSGFVRSATNDSDATITCGSDGVWTSTDANCFRTCGNVPSPLNGTYTVNSGLLVNDTALLECDSGFVRSTTNDSDATITCESDGVWTSIDANCLRTCGNVPSPLNGTFSVNSGLLVNDTALLECDSGFVRSTTNDSDATITCESDGVWTSTDANCLRTCGNVPSPLNGTFTVNSGLLVNETALLECDSGFVRSTTNDSDATITCGSDGVWTSTDANCLRTCGNVPLPLNGTYTVNSGLLVNDTALLECDSGFVRSTTNDSDATITCESDGVWTSTDANCLRTCGNVPSPLNGTFTVNSGLLVNDTALLECDSGFVRSTTNDSDATVTCESDGVWTSTDANCLRTCGNVPSPLNGTFTVNSGLLVNDTALLECDSGFVRSTTNDSDATITCESDGAWTSTDANCLRTCGNVPSPLNGTFTVNSGLLVNDTALLECDSGFVRSTSNDSDATITCESDGVWTSTHAYCIISCSTPPSISNGTFETNGTNILNDTATLACDMGFALSSDDVTITCNSDGNWDSTSAYCIRSCGAPPVVSNATFESNSTDFVVNDTAELSCDAGYERSTLLTSEATITCQSDGQWTSTSAYCIRSCGPPPDAQNATFMASSSTYIVNVTAVLVCDSGYVRSTNASEALITCGSDGQWSTTSSYCIRSCGSPPSALNATYVSNSTDFIVNDTAVFTCDAGYVRSTSNDVEATIECESDGAWTTTDAYCIRSCGTLPSARNATFRANSTPRIVNNGTAVIAEFIVNDTAVFECDASYVRSTSNDSEASIECESDGSWSTTYAYCIRSCGEPTTTQNGSYVTNSTDFTVNATAVLDCDVNYIRSTEVDAEATVTCGSDGQWSPSMAYCYRSCGAPPAALNGSYVSNSTDFIVNDTAVLACDVDYVRSTLVDDDATITCQSSGQWTSATAYCIRTCGAPPTVQYGNLGDVNVTYVVNDTLELTCDTNYTRSTAFIAEASITCQENGTWSTPTAYCVASCSSTGTTFMVATFNNVFKEGNVVIYGYVSEPSDIVVTVPHLNFEQTASVTEFVAISLPNTLDAVDNQVSNKATRIVSSSPMNMYLYHIRENSVEGTIVYPENCANMKYLVVAHDSNLIDSVMSQTVTVALEDNTVVTLVEHETGVSSTNVLNQYDVMHHQALGLSGATITASTNVLVFAGHNCANVPDNSVGNCDYIIEQMPPVASLRRAYVMTYQKPRPHFSVRVVAPYSDTDVTIYAANGTAISTVTLSESESYFESFFNSDSISITSTKDILVAQYAHGLESDNSNVGDPAYVVIPSLTQFTTEYRMIMDPDMFSEHYIAITIRDDHDISGLLVNDAALTSTSYEQVDVPGVGIYTVLHEQITSFQNKKVTVTHTNGTVDFGVVQYGYSAKLGYALAPSRNTPAYF